jgi:antitoxin VapB
MNIPDRGREKRLVRLFRNGRSQAVRIPKEWEFEGEEVELYPLPDGGLVMKTVRTDGLLDYLKTAEPWTGGKFVEDDTHLPPLDEPRFR